MVVFSGKQTVLEFTGKYLKVQAEFIMQINI